MFTYILRTFGSIHFSIGHKETKNLRAAYVTLYDPFTEKVPRFFGLLFHGFTLYEVQILR